jgi:hypothetical protein
MKTFSSRLGLLSVLGFIGRFKASIFLGKVPLHLESNFELEHILLNEIEGVLGHSHRAFTEKRLAGIERAVEPIFTSLPKNEYGKLERAAVSYVLFRIFVQRHGWFVTGLEPFKAMAEWNSSSPTSMLQSHVPDYITGLFDSRVDKTGFDVHEIAVLAATLEHLVHKESLTRLGASYRSFKQTVEDVVSHEEVEQIMDTYMALYILGPLVQNISNVSPQWVRVLRANATRLYPGFPRVQEFLREVQVSVSSSRDYFYFSDVARLVETVGDRYGRWQDRDCHQLKNMLVEMEDPSPGGAGRVRLADFYDGALNHGKWQLVERVDYLRKLGALDESRPDLLRVIIPNYVNGPSNCVASSSYYSVCCINECDELLGQIERRVAESDAVPEQIKAIVTSISSSTTSMNRTLSPWLLYRLSQAAGHHGGRIPLHGRLFAQWLHFAFPRECPYPHIVGATRPQTADSWVREHRIDFAADKAEMFHHIEMQASHQMPYNGSVDDASGMESGMWTMDEELVVCRAVPSSRPSLSGRSLVIVVLRVLLFLAAIGSATLGLMRTFDYKASDVLKHKEKSYV